MKKRIAALLAGLMLLSALTGCNASDHDNASAHPDTLNALNADVGTLSSLQTSLSASKADEGQGTIYGEQEIDYILKGATLLAAGGGGSYSLGTQILEAFKDQNPHVKIEIELYDVQDMKDGESTFGVGIMGSPSAHATVEDLAKVALLSYGETLELARRYGKNPEYALALELGGANTLIPLLCAMKYDLKVVDADLCGRAVPGLETTLSSVNGLPTAPFALTDSAGNSYDINMADPYDAAGVESVAVAILDHLQSNGGFTGFYFSGEEISKNVPVNSLTQCMQIGQCIEEFQNMSIEERRAKPLFQMLNEMNYPIQCATLTTKASPVQYFHQESAAGGARDKGSYYLGVEGEPGNYFYIQFNNETMAVSVLNDSGKYDCIATAPCIIAMYDENTGMPLTNADLKEQILSGNGDALNVMLGIIKVDGKWWNDTDATARAWKPYLEEAGYTGKIVRYVFD